MGHGMLKRRTSDTEFVESLEIQEHNCALAIHIRRAIASLCGVESESLCAEDDTNTLLKLIKGWESLDQIEFVMALEDSIGDEDVRVYGPNLGRMPPLSKTHHFRFRTATSPNFGEWVVDCVKLLAVR